MKLMEGTNRSTRWWVLVGALMGAQLAVADVLYLASGDRLTGDIDSVTGGKVILKTDFAGTINVSLDTIAQMESEKNFDLRRDGQETVSGQFVVSAGAQAFQIEDGESTALDLTTVSSAKQDNLGIRDLGSDWANRFDAGISVASGNTETESQNYGFESLLTRGRSEHRLAGTFNQQKDDGEKTKDKTDLGYRYRRFFGERWYGTGSLTYFKDQFAGVDSRYTAGVGAGYQFWDNSLGALSSDLGISYVDEELDGMEEQNPAMRWGLDYNRFLWAKNLEIFYNHSTLFIPQGGRGTVYNGSTGLRMSVTDLITANLRLDIAHQTDPAPDREKTDLTYVIGIGLVF